MRKVIILLSILLVACSRNSDSIDCARARYIQQAMQVRETMSTEGPWLTDVINCLVMVYYSMPDDGIVKMVRMTEQERSEAWRYILLNCSTVVTEAEYKVQHQKIYDEDIADIMRFVEKHEYCLK